ncbi:MULTISPECIES: hypothetical protein [unclassified Mesorhizobium]|uniref:hypothetical protein n=1 Tax=unclassified Mesorhizobium TaxID=325217 RepID=UPI0016728F99|nr:MULTISPECIES: hypothetical protein [unclassified Mesorhizobium]
MALMFFDELLQRRFGRLAVGQRADGARQRHYRREKPEKQEGAERPQHDRPEHAA